MWLIWLLIAVSLIAFYIFTSSLKHNIPSEREETSPEMESDNGDTQSVEHNLDTQRRTISIEESLELIENTKALINELRWKAVAKEVIPIAEFRATELQRLCGLLLTAETPFILNSSKEQAVGHLKWFQEEAEEHPDAPWLIKNPHWMTGEIRDLYNKGLYRLAERDLIGNSFEDEKWISEVRSYIDKEAPNYKVSLEKINRLRFQESEDDTKSCMLAGARIGKITDRVKIRDPYTSDFASKTHNRGMLSDFVGTVDYADMLWISYEKEVPKNYSGIKCRLELNESGELEVVTELIQKPDPSTIWVHLPLREPRGSISRLPYFPHYIDLSPEERYTYLTWLKDIDKPIDIGYVFLLFYGLEKHLLMGDIERAVNLIERLIRHHKNKSFQTYARNAIIHSCIMRDRLDILATKEDFCDVESINNTQLLLLHQLGLGISPDQLLYIFKKLYPKCRKVVRDDKAHLIKEILGVLEEDFGASSLGISDLDISQCNTTVEVRFCNYTFPYEVRFVEMTNFYNLPSFLNRISEVFEMSYERYKSGKRLKRREKPPKEIRGVQESARLD